jgi:hypothetical protein
VIPTSRVGLRSMEPDAMDEWGGAPNLHVHGRLSRVMIVAEVGGAGL